MQVRFVFWNLLSLYILYRTQINKIVTLYIYILIYLHCTSIPPCVDVCVTTYGIVFLWSQHNVKSKKKKLKKKLKKKKFKIKRATLSCTLYGRSTVRVKIKKKIGPCIFVLCYLVRYNLVSTYCSFPFLCGGKNSRQMCTFPTLQNLVLGLNTIKNVKYPIIKICSRPISVFTLCAFHGLNIIYNRSLQKVKVIFNPTTFGLL